MKSVILTVLVLLLISQSEALKCNCGGGRQCPTGNIETCSGLANVCVSVRFHPPVNNYFRGCYAASDCNKLVQFGVATCRSCNTDLCNR